MTRKQLGTAILSLNLLGGILAVGLATAAPDLAVSPSPSDPISDRSVSMNTTRTAETLTGFVRDSLGGSLERAVVFLTPLGSDASSRSTFTDREGRYSFDKVTPGKYRLTALKDGYPAVVGAISTWVQRKLDLVLAPPDRPGPRPAGAEWVMSAPRRDILRDLDAVEAMGSGHEPSTASPPYVTPGADPTASDARAARLNGVEPFLQTFDGEIRQSFTQTQPAASGDAPEAKGGRGTATSLLLGSPIGRNLHFDLLGERERESLSWRDAGIEARQSSADRVRVNLRYDEAKVGRLDVRASYDYDALLFESAAGAPSGAAGPSRELKSWGYDAGWVRSLGGEGDDDSVQVDVRYRGSAVVDPTRIRRGKRGDDAVDDDTSTEADVWRTAARFSKSIGSEHHVHVGVRARVFSFGGAVDAPIIAAAERDPAPFEEFGREGWNVSISAGESWRVLDPVALDFGFDVSRSAFTAGRLREAIVPQAGVTFTPGKTTVRGAISYVALRRDVSRDANGASMIETVDATRPEQVIGYRLRVERQIGGVLAILDAESRPFFYDSIGRRWTSSSVDDLARALYLSDGAASVREVSLALEGHPFDGALLAFGAGAGRTQGRVAASIPYHDLARVVDDGSIDYVVARLNGRFEKSDTGFRLEVTRLGQDPRTPGDDEPYGDRRVTAQVLQGLGFLHPGNTDWTILLEYSSYVPEAARGQTVRDPDPALRASLNRFSGGVSVRF